MGQVRPIYRDAVMYRRAHHNRSRPAPDFSPGPDSRDIHAHHALGHAPAWQMHASRAWTTCRIAIRGDFSSGATCSMAVVSTLPRGLPPIVYASRQPTLGLPHHQGHIWKAMTQSTELDCQYMHGRTSGLNLGRFVSVCRAASESRKPAEILTLLPRLKHGVVSCDRWQPR